MASDPGVSFQACQEPKLSDVEEMSRSSSILVPSTPSEDMMNRPLLRLIVWQATGSAVNTPPGRTTWWRCVIQDPIHMYSHFIV